MQQQLITIVNQQLEYKLEAIVRKQQISHQNYDKLNIQQYRKIESTLKENQILKWQNYKYSCEFYNEEKLLYLKSHIEQLLELINEVPSTISNLVVQKIEQELEDQKQLIIKDNNHQKFFSFDETKQTQQNNQSSKNNMNIQEYIQELEKKMRDEIMLKENQINNDQQTIRRLRIEKIEIDQQVKQLLTQYDLVIKQNQKQQDKIKSLEFDLKNIQKQLDATTREMLQRSKEVQIQIIQTQPNEKSTSDSFYEQKVNHMEHTFLKQSEAIKKLQEQNQQLQQQLQQEQLLNQNLYSNLVNLDAQTEKAIYLKNSILNEIEQQKSAPISKNNIGSIKNDGSQNSPYSTLENHEKQWNRLILHISKLQNERRILLQRVSDLLNENFKTSQFLLNLFDLMDKPDFIVNLKSIRNICAQQREIVSDRLIEIVKERQVLGDQNMQFENY